METNSSCVWNSLSNLDESPEAEFESGRSMARRKRIQFSEQIETLEYDSGYSSELLTSDTPYQEKKSKPKSLLNAFKQTFMQSFGSK
jgi:hypothetical protein